MYVIHFMHSKLVKIYKNLRTFLDLMIKFILSNVRFRYLLGKRLVVVDYISINIKK